jgi:heat shock protein HtpX
MISALRKIEGRGELPGATSSVMEMCIDNPREGFGELFDTHPSVESRVAALVKFAGGHDPGPIALPPPQNDEQPDQDTAPQQGAPGPWSSSETGNAPIPDLSPFGTTESAPTTGPWSEPPAGLGGSPASEPSGPSAGPWGPHRSN